MKRFAQLSVILTFSLCLLTPSLSAQSLDSYVILDEDQAKAGKEIQDGFKEEKADLELQLQKLIKDREVAKRDKNTSLEKKRTAEIAATRKQLNELPKKYTEQFSEILTEDQKESLEIDSDFYAKELAAEQARMKAVEAEKKAASKPAAKKAPAKKSVKK